MILGTLFIRSRLRRLCHGGSLIVWCAPAFICKRMDRKCYIGTSVGVLIGIGIFVVVQLIKIADRKQFKADITNWIKDGIKEALKEEAKDAIRDGIKEALKEEAKDAIRDGIKEALKEDREGDGKD